MCGWFAPSAPKKKEKKEKKSKNRWLIQIDGVERGGEGGGRGDEGVDTTQIIAGLWAQRSKHGLTPDHPPHTSHTRASRLPLSIYGEIGLKNRQIDSAASGATVVKSGNTAVQ
jgi:hypothetical protein